MALLFEAVVPAGQRLAQGAGCNFFWLQFNNCCGETLKITVETLPKAALDPTDGVVLSDFADEEEPDEIPPHDYLPRGFL
jgi:hypothetical protein